MLKTEWLGNAPGDVCLLVRLFRTLSERSEPAATESPRDDVLW